MELFQAIAERIESYHEQQAASQNQEYNRKAIKTLILDVVTRWNSVFFMLERALEFSEVSQTIVLYVRITKILIFIYVGDKCVDFTSCREDISSLLTFSC